MSDIPSRSGAAEENGKPRLGFKNLLRMFRRKGNSESALRDAIEELIEELPPVQASRPAPTGSSAVAFNIQVETPDAASVQNAPGTKDLSAYSGLGSWVDIFNSKPWSTPG